MSDKQKFNRGMMLSGIIIGAVGGVIVGANSDPWVAVGLFIWTWGNNICRTQAKAL